MMIVHKLSNIKKYIPWPFAYCDLGHNSLVVHEAKSLTHYPIPALLWESSVAKPNFFITPRPISLNICC